MEIALARPVTYAYYQDADIALQAAVLVHAIAEHQPFIEGNKRTAALVLAAFLEENSYLLTATKQDRAAWILDLSEGVTPEELAGRIRAALVRVEKE